MNTITDTIVQQLRHDPTVTSDDVFRAIREYNTRHRQWLTHARWQAVAVEIITRLQLAKPIRRERS